ncbi:UNVERIFIED_CONTAM: hypothetical protein Scaly_2953100 [Sesamum calycinum]|uniref:Uncharacterized protein n=1 Tax=Sesamum calycinum TaxID=2727403 RepID=A0AAW2KUE2_9LAMI
MALNPQLFPNGMPVPFVSEMFFWPEMASSLRLTRSLALKVELLKQEELSTCQIFVWSFVASKPVENFVAFDLPLLYVHDEKFNQPIFFCNNISGHVDPVVPDNEHRALYSTHSFKILFKEGGCGTFVPLFFNLIASVRQYNQHARAEPQPRMDPLQAAQTPVDDMMRHAYVDPNDPTRIFLQQPNSETQLRRRTYQSHNAANQI